jgi:hypothetical protein
MSWARNPGACEAFANPAEGPEEVLAELAGERVAAFKEGQGLVVARNTQSRPLYYKGFP